MSIGVLLVDDHPVVRTGLRTVLELEPGLTVVGEAENGESAVALAQACRPDVVLCDLRMGDGIDGIRTTALLRELRPAPAVIIVTTFGRDADVLGALEAGAAGYLLKDVGPQTIVQTIHAAARGETLLGPQMAARIVENVRNPMPRLTAREADVLALLAAGAANRDIAHRLYVSETTVKSHLESIFSKLDVDSRSRAVRRAQQIGLI